MKVRENTSVSLCAALSSSQAGVHCHAVVVQSFGGKQWRAREGPRDPVVPVVPVHLECWSIAAGGLSCVQVQD